MPENLSVRALRLGVDNVPRMTALGTISRLVVQQSSTRPFTPSRRSLVTIAKTAYTLFGALPIPRGVIRAQIRLSSTLPSSPIFKAIANHDPISPAIIHSASDRTFSYGNLLQDVSLAKARLSVIAEGRSLGGERIAFLAENSYDYVGAQDNIRNDRRIEVDHVFPSK